MKKIKRLLCKIGWHGLPPFWKDWESLGSDGASEHAKCKWCGYEGRIDSTGALF